MANTIPIFDKEKDIRVHSIKYCDGKVVSDEWSTMTPGEYHRQCTRAALYIALFSLTMFVIVGIILV